MCVLVGLAGSPAQAVSAEGEESGKPAGSSAGESAGGADESGESASQPEDEAGIDEQLEALEKEVERKQGESDEEQAGAKEATDVEAIEREVAQSGGGGDSRAAKTALNPEISVILDTGFAWTENDPTLVGGPDPKSFGPFLQSVELALQADVDPFFTFDSHLVAALDGLKIGEAYATTLALPAKLQVRVGKFKTAFGRVNPVHLHTWHFTALPLVNGKFLGPAGLNGLGGEISQLLPVPWFAEWRLAVQDLSGPPTGRAFLRKPERLEGFLDLVVTGRLEQFFSLSGDWDLLWGLSGAVGRNDSAAKILGDQAETDEVYETGIYATDVFVKFRPEAKGGRSELGWQTEAMVRGRETPRGQLTDVGGYSYMYYQPNRNWEFGGRYEYVTGPLKRESDYLHPDWLEARQRAGVSIAAFPSNFSRLRLEYMAGRFRGGIEELSHTVYLQTQFVTGAHGAHKY